MLDAGTAERLRRHWDDGWNDGDVETIMAPFAPDVVFSSPFVARVSGEAGRRSISGRDELQAYVERALHRTPGIRYSIHETFLGDDALVLVYTCHLPDGRVKDGADLMRVDATGQVVEWRCHYTAASLD